MLENTVTSESAAAVAPALETSTIRELSAPVEQGERITALDTLRGFALLGILLMNIVPFGMNAAAYDNPTVTGGSTGPNLAVWTALHILAEGKMRCLFSLVFGAGIVLLTSRLERRGESGDIYYRRTLWLLLFGVVHAYGLWLGDILYPYALCGLALFPFRKLAARKLMILGAVLIVLTAGFYIGMGVENRTTITEGQAALAAEREGRKLTSKEEDAKKKYEDWRKSNRPTSEEIQKDIAEWRGGFLSVLKARAKAVAPWHALPYYSPINWDMWSMMLIGMGLMKTNVLTAGKTYRFYGLLAVIGYGIGVPLNTYTAMIIIQSGFDPVTHWFANSTYDAGRLSIALGHLGMVMLIAKAGAMRWMMSPLGAIGQMAFSNYILHSVICTFLFTGWGLGMYGRLERYQLYYVVAAIWIFQLIVSPIWLKYFRFGPLEWGWRSLTYWKRQPMRLGVCA